MSEIRMYKFVAGKRQYVQNVDHLRTKPFVSRAFLNFLFITCLKTIWELVDLENVSGTIRTAFKWNETEPYFCATSFRSQLIATEHKRNDWSQNLSKSDITKDEKISHLNELYKVYCKANLYFSLMEHNWLTHRIDR